jgi:hypothetical protein
VKRFNRRQFLIRSGVAAGLVAQVTSPKHLLKALAAPGSDSQTPAAEKSFSNPPAALYNTNLRTAIGLGDEPASTVDKYGQILLSRQAATRLKFDSPLQAADQAEWSQSLLDGYLPIVETRLHKGKASLAWAAFSSDHGGVKADYIEVTDANVPYQVTLLFPLTTSIRIEGGAVVDDGKVLAVFPAPKRSAVTLAKYNLVTPEAIRSGTPDEDNPTLSVSGVDPAFHASRGAFLNRWIEYRFPVEAGQTYHVFLGVVPQKGSPGQNILKLSVNEQNQWVDYSLFPPNVPLLREFTVTPAGNELRVKSAFDSSATDPYRRTHLSGIWVFTRPVDEREVVKGALGREALFYVQCAQERLEDIASSVTLDYEPTRSGEGRCIRLPYDLGAGDASKLASISPASARAAEKARWESLLRNGAQLITGVPHLDNLYRTSVINLLLCRTRFAGQGEHGQDIYVVKPGPDLYDDFWSRDGAYISTTFDVAGLPEEAEKSLRLFWHTHLTGILATWGQQPTGEWAAPITEWDAQGQALWTLVNHYEFTHDLEWLKRVYRSIVKGTLWMKNATEQTQFVNENGEKPIYYGLLPLGEGEAIAYGYNYYHCFWGVLGLRQALRAAQALDQADDVEWIKKLYDDFSSNLLASVKLASQRVTGNKFIPATPFDPKAPIWGSIAALYPARFLDPHDPLITGTLEMLDAEAQEDTWLYEPNHLWTYITVEGAMCHLLRDELPMFYRLYNGYVSHVSPTNAWVEGISLPDRAGSGDMPHGWGAAEYVTIHRNSLVYENERKLEFCWGVQPEWLHDGARLSAKRAATKFGRVDFSFQRSGPELVFDYSLASGGHEAPEETRLHVPKLKEAISSVRINGRSRTVAPGESVIKLG